MQKDKIVIDLSGRPGREKRLVTILSAMVKTAIIENPEAVEADTPATTSRVPGSELNRVAGVSPP